MNSNPVFNSVQQLLSQGDTGQALQVLIAFLEKDASRPDILRTLRVVEANYTAARQQEIKGIIGFVAVIWGVFLLECVLPFHLISYGLTPRTVSGLIGIPVMPFLHENWQHISNVNRRPCWLDKFF